MRQFFPSSGQRSGVLASASVLPMNIQDWFPLGLSLISLKAKGLLSLLHHHSSKATILRCSAFFIVQLSHLYMTTGKTIALTRWIFADKVMSLIFNMLSSLVITFLPRSKCLCSLTLENRTFNAKFWFLEMMLTANINWWDVSLRFLLILINYLKIFTIITSCISWVLEVA